MAELQLGDNPVPIENEQLQWSLAFKPPPFPFNLESYIICCGIIICIILGNLEAQYKWALYYGVWNFLGHISLRAALTLALSLFTQWGFKYFLVEFLVLREYIAEKIEEQVLTTVARLWSIQIDPDMEGNQADQLLRREHELPRAVWDLLTGGCLLVLNLVWIVVLVYLIRGLEKLSALLCIEYDNWLWKLIFRLIAVIKELNLWLDYTPATHDIWVSTWRLGGQVTFQLVLVTVLFYIIFLLRAKALLAQAAFQDVAIKEKLGFWAANLRGTALHLVSYTAYQVISFIVAANRLNYIHADKWTTWRLDYLVGLRGERLGFPGGQFLEYALLSVAMGIMTMAVHIVLRFATRVLINLCSPIWTSFILWKTLWNARTVERIVGLYLKAMESDFSLDNPLMCRAMTTLLFGDSGPLPIIIPDDHNVEGMW